MIAAPECVIAEGAAFFGKHQLIMEFSKKANNSLRNLKVPLEIYSTRELY